MQPSQVTSSPITLLSSYASATVVDSGRIIILFLLAVIKFRCTLLPANERLVVGGGIGLPLLRCGEVPVAVGLFTGRTPIPAG
jgi:hypothetical protein